MAITLRRGGLLVMDDRSARLKALDDGIDCIRTDDFLRRLDAGEFSLL